MTESLKQWTSLKVREERLAPFITNHDQDRIATQLKGDTSGLVLAATVLMTLPGTPFIYYGEEIGMPNGNYESKEGRDLAKRTPMLWNDDPNHGFTCRSCRPWKLFSTEEIELNVESERKESTSLWNTYRKLIRLRVEDQTLRQGSLGLFEKVPTGVEAYFRRSLNQTDVVLLNFSKKPSSSFELPIPSFNDRLEATRIFGDADFNVKNRDPGGESLTPKIQ